MRTAAKTSSSMTARTTAVGAPMGKRRLMGFQEASSNLLAGPKLNTSPEDCR